MFTCAFPVSTWVGRRIASRWSASDWTEGSLATNRARQLITEGAVIVASILLAFGIDAGWAHRTDLLRRDHLKSALRSDVEATQVVMLERREWAESVVARARAILHGIVAGAEGTELDALIFDVGDVFVKGEWNPINPTYEQALGSGELSLIDDLQLRSLLARYNEALDSFSSLQVSVVTQYYGQLEPFLVANVDYSEVAWGEMSESLVRTRFSTDASALAARRDFSNLLNLKLEIELEAIAALEVTLALTEDLLNSLSE